MDSASQTAVILLSDAGQQTIGKCQHSVNKVNWFFYQREKVEQQKTKQG